MEIHLGPISGNRHQVKFKTFEHFQGFHYGTEHSSGIDIKADISKEIGPGEVFTFHTGFALELPEELDAHIIPRSSSGSRGLVIANQHGLIDSDYRGEVLLKMRNVTSRTIFVDMGERIAQMYFKEKPRVHLIEVEELSETKRGSGGFGSTGK